MDPRTLPSSWTVLQGGGHATLGEPFRNHVVARDLNGRLLLVVGDTSDWDSIPLRDLPLRPTPEDASVQAPLGVASWGKLLMMYPQGVVAPIVSTYSPETGVAWVPETPVFGNATGTNNGPINMAIITTPPDGYVKVDAVRGALTLPKGTRRTYENLRKAIEEALGT